jgi:cation:H+ antiporter
LHDGRLYRLEALLLLLFFITITVWTVYGAVRPAAITLIELPEGSGPQATEINLSKSILYIILGLIGLAVGAKLAVYGAVVIGEAIGLSKAVIGLTIIAIGTSLPELVTCVVASLKGHHDISIGNLVGSNIFNTLLVTGISGTVKPFVVSPNFAGGYDYWAMMGVGFLFLGLGWAGRGMMGKKSGLLLCTGYILYVWYTIRLNA